jgi:hypothetical protein
MLIRHFVVPSLTLVVLGCAALVADAQTTGPIDGGGKSETKAGKQDSMQKLTPERVMALLKDKGHQATINKTQQGQTVVAVIQQDGWQYNLNIQFTPNGMDWYFSSALTTPGQTFSNQQLLALMKKNWDLGCGQIFSISTDNRLYLETPNYTTNNITDQVFYQTLTNHLNTIRNNYDLWKVS